MITCNLCQVEYEIKYISFENKEGTTIHICSECGYCEFCEEKMEEPCTASNWLPYKRPQFPSGWIFKTGEELKDFWVEDTILVCDFCYKVEYCSTCQYKCKNFCDECETTCCHCECKESIH